MIPQKKDRKPQKIKSKKSIYCNVYLCILMFPYFCRIYTTNQPMIGYSQIWWSSCFLPLGIDMFYVVSMFFRPKRRRHLIFLSFSPDMPRYCIPTFPAIRNFFVSLLLFHAHQHHFKISQPSPFTIHHIWVTHVPLAPHGRVVPLGRQHFGNGHLLRWQAVHLPRPQHRGEAGSHGVAPRHDGHARGSAARLTWAAKWRSDEVTKWKNWTKSLDNWIHSGPLSLVPVNLGNPWKPVPVHHSSFSLSWFPIFLPTKICSGTGKT